MNPISPRLPTSHPPGSEGKLRVLEARAAARLPLFVEGDALGPLPHPPLDARRRSRRLLAALPMPAAS